MRLGCNTVLFATQDLQGALERVAWCGFTEVELAAIPGMCEHIEPEQDNVQEIRRQIEEAGLRAVAIEAAMNLSVAENILRFLSVLRFAASLGVEVVNTGNGGKSDDIESERAIYQAIRELAPRAQDLGVKIGIKAHVNQAIYNTASALRALDAVPVEGWGINYDASHLYRVGEDVVQAVQQLGQRIVSVHIRDTMGTFDDTFRNRIAAFVEQVQIGGPLDASGDDGLAAQEVIEGAIRSWEHGTIEEIQG